MSLKTTRGDKGAPTKGRGAPSNLEGRFETWAREAEHDGWDSPAAAGETDEPPPLATQVSFEQAKSIISRNDSPDLSFEQSINPYRGCEHGCVYCLAGDTPILMADGSANPLGDLRVGDEIIGTEKSGHYRRYVKTRVLAHWRTRKPAWRLQLADNTTLIASADHRFLTERGWKYVARSDSPTPRPHLTLNNSLMGFGALRQLPTSMATGEYRRGYLCGLIRGDGHLQIYRYARAGRANADQYRFRLAMADGEALERAAGFLSDFGVATDRFLFQAETAVRKRMETIRTSARRSIEAIQRLVQWPDRHEGDWARGFIAGIFDAEGSFSNGCIRIANTDSQIIGVTRSVLAQLDFDTVVETAQARPRPLHYVRVRGGLREHLRFFSGFNPAIGRKRDICGQAVKSRADLAVAAIESTGELREMFDITTGTGDFIANGVISHNCYARPSHGYLGLSPGLDFETRIVAKKNAAEVLRNELSAPAYRCKMIAIGANTDAYQPVERELRITRSIIEVLSECEHPAAFITKSSLIERDIDLLAPMAAKNLVRAFVSVTNLDPELARKLEPRAAAPYRRIETIRRLSTAGIPVGVMVAPVIPFMTDRNLEEILESARDAGATAASYVLLRLPYEVAPLFKDWLSSHYPLKAVHVISLVRQMSGGKDYDSTFGTRQRGTGTFATLLEQRFRIACERMGLNRNRGPALDTTRFRPPGDASQLGLF